MRCASATDAAVVHHVGKVLILYVPIVFRRTPDTWRVSDQSGRAEVLVRPVGGSERVVVSTSGGEQPVWRRDGRELFYVGPDIRVRSVAVQASGARLPTFGAPVLLNIPPIFQPHWGTAYDVTPDGQRIYFLQENTDRAPREINLVLGWTALLK